MSTELELARTLTIGKVLSRSAVKNPAKIAVSLGDYHLTYKELNNRVNRLANALMLLGIKRNDKVAVLLLNSIEIIECYFACAKIGAVCVPINFRLLSNEVAYQLNHSDSKALLFQGKFAEVVMLARQMPNKIEHYICIGQDPPAFALRYEMIKEESSSDEPNIVLNDEDPSHIMYTSGTSGLPKGVVLTHKNQMMGAFNFLCMFTIGERDKWLCIPPLFHEAAYIMCLVFVFVGGSIVLQTEFDPIKALKIIEDEKITTLFLVPSMWLSLLEVPELESYNGSTLRLANTGAAPIPEEVKMRISAHFENAGVFNTFGQTEMSGATTTLQGEDALAKPGSVGKPGPLVEIRIVDLEGNDVNDNEVGEIIYRGPTLMRDYYKDPGATEAAIIDGWFHSGDLVYRDVDGFIYVVDRLKDMIISGGENIYSTEVEKVLYSHPDVIEAVVIGIPDDKWGEIVRAVVVKQPGKALTEEEIIRYCRNYIAGYKCPKSVLFVSSLPRNATGKVLKYKLKAKAPDER